MYRWGEVLLLQRDGFDSRRAVVCLSMCLASALCSTARAEERVLLDDLLQEALTKNPQIQAAREMHVAAEAGITHARWLDNPRVDVMLGGEDVQTRVGPQERTVSLSQELPWPHKLILRSQAASAEADAAASHITAAELDVLTQVKHLYYQLHWIHQSIDVAHADQLLLEHFESVAQARYASGQGSQIDALKAHTELLTVADRLLMLAHERGSVEAQLNALLNRSIDMPIGRPADVAVTPLTYSEAELLAWSAEHRPDIHAAKANNAQAVAEHRLARWMYLPDVELNARYIEIGGGTTSHPDDGQDAWMVGFAFDIPLWEPRVRADVRAAAAQRRAAEQRVIDTENQSLAEVRTHYAHAHHAWQAEALYRTALIPQTEQALDSAQAGYEGGTVMFLDLLDAQRLWLEAQLAYWQAYTNYGTAVASLERAVGQAVLP